MNIDEIEKRYEEIRQACLRQANIHPEDSATCSVALQKSVRMNTFSLMLASLCDDFIAMVRQLEADNAGLVTCLKNIKDTAEWRGDSATVKSIDEAIAQHGGKV